MSCLDATFTLTPRSPWFYDSSSRQSSLQCYGADFFTFGGYDFSALHAADRFFFSWYTAADPTVDYSGYKNRARVPFLSFYADLTDLGTAKSLALIFGFEAQFSGLDARVLVYTDLGLISNQTLAINDNQFLLEIESLDNPLRLYFIHAGGDWFFKGLSGYVV